MKRVDLLLFEKGLAPSRSKAQEWILSGRVFSLEGEIRKPITKPSQTLSPEVELIIEGLEEAQQYVSRGGWKLKGALGRVALEVSGFEILDIGISTGGFTDCLLQAGAASVVGVDVGHQQLAEKLRKDPRVILFEGVNARNLESVDHLVRGAEGRSFDLIVVDVSFISLTLVLPGAIKYLKESGRILALVKPQFEVGRGGLGKNGVVKDESLYEEVEQKIRSMCRVSAIDVLDYFSSPIEGSDGNREFFVFGKIAKRP